MTDPNETPVPQATLSDVLRLVAELATVPAMGRRGRQILLALHTAGQDVDTMTGLVIDGQAHEARVRQECAACGCRDGWHTFKKHDGAWFGRGHWYENHADAERHAARVHGHLVTHFVAETDTEQTP